MSLKEIQIVTFDNPYPPNFGGVIDVFYKIEALALEGVKIYLHYYYKDRKDIGPLKELCEEVHAYKRNTSLFNFFHWLPFRVKSRDNKHLCLNLKKINKPVLFEGLHSTSVLVNNTFKFPVYVRTHNVEHQYIFGLAKSENNWVKKISYYFEALKLRRYQSILKEAEKIITLSKYDYSFFSKRFDSHVSFIPVFHGNNEINENNSLINDDAEKYALYHGDLTSPSNVQSVMFLIDIFKNLNHKLIIASSTKPKKIEKLISNNSNCIFKELQSNKKLDELIENAHVNVLYSNQKSGTKLKVFNALYKGKHVVVNNNIVDDKSILDLCFVVNTREEYINIVNDVFNLDYEISTNRLETLDLYSSKKNAKQFITLFN
ncbi:glycosyltransferase family protein [Ichthyenterobacterium magnum]|uniref:Glycosyltransferase involved in cell wall biosynthesis n=1 Tax=Ichthyenterobacterium magnum TaxID=1230530 RepID=A0A420DV36_9FLAO|nr:hypothetical protein [Ichthyenterobacterium magnum]RKE98105.1 hypothetical protein BXY80_0176 [Ichthyenterobacterium magnum]